MLNKFTVKQELKLLKNMLEIDTFNTRLSNAAPEKRAELEIKHRILCGLGEKEKEKFALVHDLLSQRLEEWFIQNKYPRCPLDLWIGVLKKIVRTPPKFFSLMGRNDAAIYRWSKRQGEWWRWDRPTAETRFRYLSKQLVQLNKPEADEIMEDILNA